jgi:MFS-type transporter involved in bile tolerance (Atg22 family)
VWIITCSSHIKPLSGFFSLFHRLASFAGPRLLAVDPWGPVDDVAVGGWTKEKRDARKVVFIFFVVLAVALLMSRSKSGLRAVQGIRV